MNDPLNPGVVRPIEKDAAETAAATEDTRSFWRRLFTSLRPSVSVGADKKTGKPVVSVTVSGGIDFAFMVAGALLAIYLGSLLTGCATEDRRMYSAESSSTDHARHVAEMNAGQLDAEDLAYFDAREKLWSRLMTR